MSRDFDVIVERLLCSLKSECGNETGVELPSKWQGVDMHTQFVCSLLYQVLYLATRMILINILNMNAKG